MTKLNRPRVFKLQDKKVKVVFFVSNAGSQDLANFVDGISEEAIYFREEMSPESINTITQAQILLYTLGNWKTFDVELEHGISEPTQSLSFKIKDVELATFRKELLLAKTI